MKINWKVRIKNKNFWLTVIPALVLLVQLVAMVFGFRIDVDELEGKIIAAVDAAFALLATLGIVTDPTTKGLSDSEQAMTYDKPKA